MGAYVWAFVGCLLAVLIVSVAFGAGYDDGWEAGRASLVEYYQDADLARQNAGAGVPSLGFIGWKTDEGRVLIEDYGK